MGGKARTAGVRLESSALGAATHDRHRSGCRLPTEEGLRCRHKHCATSAFRCLSGITTC